MRPNIENLKVWASGKTTTGYQRALAMQEFERLITYVEYLEKTPKLELYMPSMANGKKVLAALKEWQDSMTDEERKVMFTP